MADLTLNLKLRSLTVLYGNWPWPFRVSIHPKVWSKTNQKVSLGMGLVQLGWMSAYLEGDDIKRFTLMCRSPPDYAANGSGQIMSTTDFRHPLPEDVQARLSATQYDRIDIGYDSANNDRSDVNIQSTPYLFWSMMKDIAAFRDVTTADSYFNFTTTKTTKWNSTFSTGHLLEITN